MSFWYHQFFQKTNEKIWPTYYSNSSRIVFVRFLEELKTPKRHFEINWPLLHTYIFKNQEKVSTLHFTYVLYIFFLRVFLVFYSLQKWKKCINLLVCSRYERVVQVADFRWILDHRSCTLYHMSSSDIELCHQFQFSILCPIEVFCLLHG